MRKLTSLVLLLVLAFGIAACGDDGDTDEQASSSASTDEETTNTSGPTVATSSTIKDLAPDEVDADASPYCEAWAELRASGPTEGKDAEALKAHYGKLVPIARRLADAADAEIEADARKAVALTEEVAASGSVEPFNRPDSKVVQERLASYALENCAA